MLGDLSTLMERRLPTRPTDITAGIRKPWLVQMYQKTSQVAEKNWMYQKVRKPWCRCIRKLNIYQKTINASENFTCAENLENIRKWGFPGADVSENFKCKRKHWMYDVSENFTCSRKLSMYQKTSHVAENIEYIRKWGSSGQLVQHIVSNHLTKI